MTSAAAARAAKGCTATPAPVLGTCCTLAPEIGSDEQANPPDQVQKHALESESVLVDNTPPRIDNLTLTGRRLRAQVVDGTSPIARVEIAIDGKPEWRPLAAADGIFDTPSEAIDADVAVLVPPGSHIVVVRAYDAAGNAVSRDVESK